MKHLYRGYIRSLMALAIMLLLTSGSAFAQWTEHSTLLTSTGLNWGGTAIVGSKIYVFGGIGVPPGGSADQALSLSQRYDLVGGNSWELSTALSAAHYGMSAEVVDNIIYVLGGQSSGNSYDAISVRFDTAGSAYSTLSTPPRAISRAASAVVGKNIYMIGGYTVASGQLAYGGTAVYNTQTDTWAQGSAPYFAVDPTAVAIGNTIYLVGGEGNDGFLTVAYKGTINGDQVTWTQIADYPVPLSRAASGVLDGKVFIAGGVGTNKSYSYNPATNKWEANYALPIEETYNLENLVVSGNSIYLVGGINNGKVFKYQAGSLAPIARIPQKDFNVGLNKGGTRTIPLSIANDGVAELSVSFAIPSEAQAWLSASSSSIAPSSIKTIALNINASTLADGKYTTTVNVQTNDPTNASIPVTVTVWVVDGLVVQQSTVTLEEGAGTWCVPCHGGAAEVIRVSEKYGDRLIAMTHHFNQAGPGATSNFDPMMFPESISLISTFQLNSFPTATVSRQLFPGQALMLGATQWDTYIQQVLDETPVAPAAIEINSYSFDAGTNRITANVTVTVTDPITWTSTTSLRLTGVIVQNDVMYGQAGLNSTGTAGVWYDPYLHQHAVRALGPEVLGKNLNVTSANLEEGTVLRPGEEFTTTIEFGVDLSRTEGATNSAIDSIIAFVPENSQLVVMAHINNGTSPGRVLNAKEVGLTDGVVTGPAIAVTNQQTALIINPQETATFNATVENLTDAPVDVTVTRVTNNVPVGWTSSLCKAAGDCEAPGTSSVTVSVPAGQSHTFLLKVTGTTASQSGTVGLRFKAGTTEIVNSYTTTTTNVTTGVETFVTAGEVVSLGQNMPNPAIGVTQFSYNVPFTGNVTMEVFDVSGAKVATVLNTRMEPGVYTADIDVTNWKSGSYMVVLSHEGKKASRMMTVIR